MLPRITTRMRTPSEDAEPWEPVYRAHVDAVYRRLGRILGPIAEREDLTQDVFLALHKALPGFRGDAKLSTLIHRIAINRACEHLRIIGGDGMEGGMDQGKLFRKAMRKDGVWQGTPIEYARAQTEYPPRDGWNHDWKR